MQKISVYWRDIPSQVIIKRGRTRGKAALPLRFQEAIDRAAMKAGRGGSDAYIADWRRETVPLEASGEPEALAAQAASDWETQYDDERLKALVANLGLEPA
ncbi:MAG: virulence factor [Halioglobus sp.]